MATGLVVLVSQPTITIVSRTSTPVVCAGSPRKLTNRQRTSNRWARLAASSIGTTPLLAVAKGNTDPPKRSPKGVYRARVVAVVDGDFGVVVGMVGVGVGTSWLLPASLSMEVSPDPSSPSVSDAGEGDGTTGATPGNPRNNDMTTGCNDIIGRWLILLVVLLPPPTCPSDDPTTAVDESHTGSMGVPNMSSWSCLMLLMSTAKTALRQCRVTV